MLATPNHAWKNHVNLSKRKRTSCGGESIETEAQYPFSSNGWCSSLQSDGADHNSNDDLAASKKVRTSSQTPTHSPHTISTTNVPFSTAFREQRSATTPNRPPTVEEQQAWSSGSSLTLDSEPASAPHRHHHAGSIGSAQPKWVRVVTSYGHTFARSDQVDDLIAAGDVDMVLTESPSPSDWGSDQRSETSLWDHIEGDVEMANVRHL